MILHDNVPAHSATFVRQFLAQKMVVVVDHPPYCPDLTPDDIFLFPRLKTVMKGARFGDVNAVKDRVTAILTSIPHETFAEAVRTLSNMCWSGWRLFLMTMKKICYIFCFVCFLKGFAEPFRHTVAVYMYLYEGIMNLQVIQSKSHTNC